MFVKKDNHPFRDLIPGVRMRPLVHEEKTLLCEFRLDAGYSIPLHQHPYEQSGYLISGKLKFFIGDECFDAGPGDSWCVPENTGHRVTILEDSHLVEIFSPIRPDYLIQE